LGKFLLDLGKIKILHLQKSIFSPSAVDSISPVARLAEVKGH